MDDAPGCGSFRSIAQGVARALLSMAAFLSLAARFALAAASRIRGASENAFRCPTRARKKLALLSRFFVAMAVR